jgi:hypothetical protein
VQWSTVRSEQVDTEDGGAVEGGLRGSQSGFRIYSENLGGLQ